MRSVMTHQFSQVPRADIQRSTFNRSHGVKTTFDAGYLVPIYVDEALPGDTFNLRLSSFARLATPLHPVMDNMYLDTFFFAVPYRLIWDNWEKFNGARANPDDSIDFLTPQVTFAEVTLGSLPDYFGLPMLAGNDITVTSFHFRAYNLIYNEWFRDQNLQDSIIVDTDDGPDTGANYLALRRRGKRHDYFTSCLPWPQKGDDVTLPLGSTANVLADTSSTGPTFRNAVGGASLGLMTVTTGANPDARFTSTGTAGSVWWNEPGLYADLSTATAATVNAIREAFQIQRLLERDARGGTRYVEIIRAHFGVVSPDFRLQRPEYLGGGSSPVSISAVPQTSSSVEDSPQGNLAAYGTVGASGHGFYKSFTEHCLIIGLVNVRADLTYSQGIERMWSRRTRYDYYLPALAHLGEQEVLRKEIYYQNDPADDEVFGYQERYAEYRYKPSRITGLFRPGISGTLDSWHLSQELSGSPLELDDAFIQDSPPIDRVIAVPSEPHFLYDGYVDLKCARPMPLYGVPGNIDRF